VSTTITTIGAFEAKTKFSDLLSRVSETGAEFVITKHDRPVARLVPATKVQSREEAAKAVAEWRRRRKRCRLGGLRIKELINEGRR
jgi:prevent-host-death family protein